MVDAPPEVPAVESDSSDESAVTNVVSESADGYSGAGDGVPPSPVFSDEDGGAVGRPIAVRPTGS
eukprot:11167055-Lingulodinium_polyedra.AAC.1